MRRTKKAILFLFLTLVVLAAGAGSYLFWLIRSSLPKAGQGATIAGLSNQVLIEQDNFGVPTIRGESLTDVFRGQGWVTARDRLFQMDLLRRRSAGRLSEILGKETLRFDIFHRKLGLARRVKTAAQNMPKENKAIFQAYADGVNAFIKQGPLPFEMRVLGYRPEPWRVDDSLLVVLAMFIDLDFAPQYFGERALTGLYKKRPKALADFLTPVTGFLDSPADPDRVLPPPALPSLSVFDLRKESAALQSHGRFELARAGSNAWALSGKHTVNGKPVVAGDPHLDLFAPNIWYRSRLVQKNGLNVTGVGLPGLPGIVIGENGDVAWSITYPSGDTLDLVKLEPAAARESRTEEILVRGEKIHTLQVNETKWGPVIFTQGKEDFAIQWTALDAEELAKLDTVEIIRAKNTDEFLGALSRWKGPVSNMIFASKEGDIAWALAGSLPKRVGFDGRTATVRDGSHFWNGYRSFSEMPKSFNPKSGYLVSANQRMVPTDKDLKQILATANNLCSPDRAYRIRQRLEESRGKWSAEDSHSIQLDIYSPTAMFYRDILLKAKSSPDFKGSPWSEVATTLVENWDGLVSVDDPVHPFLRAFRTEVLRNLVEPLWGGSELEERGLGDDPVAATYWYYVEPVVKTLTEQKPKRLLAAQFPTYEAAILDAVDKAGKSLAAHPEDLKKLRWGNMNHTEIHHPFSLALPKFLGRFFRMPEAEVGGTLTTPKVAATLYGRFHSASMRMAVELGAPEKALFNQPGGQSGNFQSPHYSDQYTLWLEGKGTPFHPQAVRTVDALRPENAE